MNRRGLIKKLESAGWYLKRHGDEHDIYKHDMPTTEPGAGPKTQRN
jgi:predicted RNA binding protein YcfA (HicA-like mRNA interferase family)